MERLRMKSPAFIRKYHHPDRNIAATLSGNSGIAISIKESAYEEDRAHPLMDLNPYRLTERTK